MKQAPAGGVPMLPAIPRSLLVSIGCISAVTILAGQSQQPTFSTANRTVAVYATVTNAVGRLLTDLERQQFEVSDNGKRQDLTLFSSDNQPITVVMLLDRSGSMRDNFNLVRDAAGSFVDTMTEGDKARIGTFSFKIQIDPEDFTAKRGELVEILRGDLQEPGPTPLWNAVDRGISALRHQEGRRVVLVFTDGVDEPMNFKNGNASKKSVLKRAEEEDVMVYAVGLSGDQGGPSSTGQSGRKQNPFPAPGPPTRGYGGGGFGSGGISPTNG